MADKLSVNSDSVTKVYQPVRDCSSDQGDLLKRLKPEQRKTAFKTKTKDGNHFATPLVIAASNGKLNPAKIRRGIYEADIKDRETLNCINDHFVEECTPLRTATVNGHLDVVKEEKADVYGKESTGSSPLRAAVYGGHLDIARKIGSGTGKRRGEGRFVPGTGKDINANTQKETVTKETSGHLREQTQQLENVQEQLRHKGEQLSEVTQQLANVQGQLQERDGQLRALTQQLTNYQGTLLERDGQLRSLTQHLTNVEGQLQEKDAQLKQVTQQLATVLRQLKKRDGQLRGRASSLTNVQGQLQEKDGQLRQMTQRLTNLEGQLQETFEENTFLEERLRAKEQELNEFEESLATAQRALCERQRQQSLDWVILRDQVQLTEKCLGKGGWGRVVKGKYCGCTVAVKQIYQELLNLSSHNRELFEREMNIASRCRHPCLLQFIGATNDEGSPLFVTELMESSLRKLLEQRSLSTAEVAVISLDVARALNYLHKKKPRPIIHRDISSANVLLWRQADQWRGKVSDYGAANFMQLTMSVCPGAVIYSAPEALTKHQTVKVDVYSFGALLCEMSIGKLPNPDRRDEQVAMVTNRMLRALIRKCLYQDPHVRPTMEYIIAELEKLR